MKVANGVYHIGKRRIVINDHSTKKDKENLKKLLDDNNRQESDKDSKGLSESGKS